MKRPQPQIFYIHGGMTFNNRREYLHFLKTRKISIEPKIRWSEAYLSKHLGSVCQIIRPRMPLMDFAHYEDWKIIFERYFPKLRNNVILIGASLGGIFLAKYLSENKFPKKILSVYLVCPPFDGRGLGEPLVGGFKLKSDLSLLLKNCPRINLLFSKNDKVVPPVHARRYAAKLPQARIVVYPHIRGHFQIPKFPEIVRMIKRDLASL